jgi:hypothetical protein
VLGDRLDVPKGHQAGAHVVGPPEEPDVLHIPYTGPGVRSGGTDTGPRRAVARQELPRQDRPLHDVVPAQAA